MAALVSHAMRRYPFSHQDGVFSYNLKSEKTAWKTSSGEEGGESALSRSMRYADPWLYGGTPTSSPATLLVTPAIVLCSCPDYLNGTKKAQRKGPVVCKKCKGTRVALAGNGEKFGTVRCYPTKTSSTSLASTFTNNGQVRAGTMRVTSSTRPSILPGTPKNDPYDLMRRSRLSNNDTPSKNKIDGTSRTSARRSILECDINPYELMSTEPNQQQPQTPPKDSSITLLNGQRIRVRPQAPNPDYEDIEIQEIQETSNNKPSRIAPDPPKCPAPEPPNRMSIQDQTENSFKSILKKSTNFEETVVMRSVILKVPKSGSHFYLPFPSNQSPRKKVQFLVENEGNKNTAQFEEPPDYEDVYECAVEAEAMSQSFESDDFEEKLRDDSNDSGDNKVCTLRRSTSECFKTEPLKVEFLDTMALRTKSPRGDSRNMFDRHNMEKLDGLLPRRKVSPRPKDPPPLPPPMSHSKEIEQKLVGITEENNADIEVQQCKFQNSINGVKKSVENDTKCQIEIMKYENSKFETINHNHELRILESRNDNSKFEVIKRQPQAPPRKRSNNKQPNVQINSNNQINIVEINKNSENSNKTIVQVTPTTIHKIQIKNEFPEVANIQTISISDNSERKTSIMINGDDCYSTVNVNDDIPLYQSSVVVKDQPIIDTTKKRSSTVYINGVFEENTPKFEICICKRKEEVTKDTNKVDKEVSTDLDRPTTPLSEILRDPVEAVRRNLVPHICGKDSLIPTPKRTEKLSKSPDISPPLRIFNFDNFEDDKDSENGSNYQYEFVDPGSDSYTDHSNRSSVTEEELLNRNKFYELLADSALLEVSENEDHHYECISRGNNNDNDPIYEEIEIPPPLPSNPPPVNLLDDLKLDKEFTTRSIFEGASKYDILSYLVDAKERGIVPEDSYTFSNISTSDESKEQQRSSSKITHNSSSIGDSSEENSLTDQTNNNNNNGLFQKNSEIERNDSGVGSETSKSSLSKYRTRNMVTTLISCEDCEISLESPNENEPLLCRKCMKRRSERKEIIMEIVETEEKYSKDLQIILEEFYQPMLVAGLLTPEQLSTIFLNVEELLENSQNLAEKLRDAVEIACEQGDEDLLTVNIGKLFLDASPMLHAFETYCVRQGPASLLLASLEKEKELLRIFLRVSQMENTLLRRMNLNSFLMVPVQRVTKYPLLLARLYKVTPSNTNNEFVREQLKDAQHKIELHLNHMNSQTKDVPSKLWRRIANNSNGNIGNGGLGRRPSTEMDLVNIKLRKIAVDVLEWNHEEAKFALEGKLWFTQPTDNNWRKGRTIKLTPINAMLVINGKPISSNTKTEREEHSLIFPKHTATREAALLLVRDKNGRYSLLRDPLYLDRCVIASDPAWQSYFEVQELLGKDTFIFKAEDEDQTKIWYQQLQYHAQGMGAWRKRRNALANIMMNGMGLKL